MRRGAGVIHRGVWGKLRGVGPVPCVELYARTRPGVHQAGRWELTMTALRSYVGGAWVTPTDEGRPVLDAVTGDEVARVSSAGIDMAAALTYGRSVGGPALRELTFHQRAGLLKALGSRLREHREELYALSA